MHLTEALKSNRSEMQLCVCKLHPHMGELLQECIEFVLDPSSKDFVTHQYKIDYVLNYIHNHLNTDIWSDVPDYKRRAYTSASFLKAAMILKSKATKENVREALAVIDRGFLLGLPLKGNVNLLTECGKRLTEKLNEQDVQHITEEIPCKKAKLESKCTSIEGTKVDIVQKPALEEFYKAYFLPEKPVIIQGCMSHWPASTKWCDTNYLLRIAGERTVPIEIGSSYSDTNFSQKLMTLREFIQEYYCEDSKELGYLAQHDLLNQVPELKNDIQIPEYCCTSRNFDDDNLFEPEINAWFGPKNTVSSLHHDPKDNLLCQVFGSKQVVLFAPSDSDYLYAHEATLLSNTAQVDPLDPDLDKYPQFSKATMYSCLLNPSEMLYIPPKWWHHVTALQKSFSVNFWWQ